MRISEENTNIEHRMMNIEIRKGGKKDEKHIYVINCICDYVWVDGICICSAY